MHRRLVGQGLQQLALVSPQFDGLIIAGCDDVLPIGADIHTQNPALMLGQPIKLVATKNGPVQRLVDLSTGVLIDHVKFLQRSLSPHRLHHGV